MKKYNISLFPNATPDKPQFAKTATRDQLTFEELHTKILDSAWSPALLTGNKRSNKNFEQCELLALDFDGELPLKDTIERLDKRQLAYSITLSKSHQIDKNGEGAKDRFRVVIPLSDSISDSSIYEATWKSMNQIFPEVDDQCKDPSRFYFASKAPYKISPNGMSYVPVEPQEVVRKTPLNTASSANRGEKAILGHGALLFLRNAATGMPGKWNKALYVAAKECARGGFSEQDAISILESACPTPFDDKDLKAFTSGWKDGEKAGLYTSLKKINKKELSEEIYEFAEEELSDEYHVMMDDCGIRGVILREHKEGLVTKSSREEIANSLGKLAKEHFHIFLDARESKQHADNFVLYTEPLAEEPKSVAFLDEPALAYHKLDFKPTSGECPLFDELISRTTNGESLKAFIWSLFIQESDRQQYIWLCGEGGNGKTSLQRFLEQCLGPACVEKRVSSIHGNRFFTHSLIGKRLAVFSDTNSATVVRSETIKEITGGGRVEVEPKGMAPFTIKLDTKLIFISNNDPDISSKNADLRRLIMCKIDPIPVGTPMDASYPDKLWKERSAILESCRKSYETLVNNNGSIPHEAQLSKDIAEDSELPFEALFDEYLTLDSDSYITTSKLYSAMERDLTRRKIKRTDFYEWMNRTYGIKNIRKTIGDTKKRVLTGIKLK